MASRILTVKQAIYTSTIKAQAIYASTIKAQAIYASTIMVKNINESYRDRYPVGACGSIQPIGLVLPTSDSSFMHSQSIQCSVEVEPAKEHQPASVFESSSRSRRNVRFFGSDETYFIINRKDISPSERRKSWYGKSELKKSSFQQQNARGEQDTDTAGFDRLGAWDDQMMLTATDAFLESQRAYHRMMTVSSVLAEQERQRNTGIRNQDSLSETYMESIKRSRQALFIAALLSQEKQRRSQKAINREAFIEQKSAIC